MLRLKRGVEPILPTNGKTPLHRLSPFGLCLLRRNSPNMPRRYEGATENWGNQSHLQVQHMLHVDATQTHRVFLKSPPLKTWIHDPLLIWVMTPFQGHGDSRLGGRHDAGGPSLLLPQAPEVPSETRGRGAIGHGPELKGNLVWFGYTWTKRGLQYKTRVCTQE